MCKQNKIVHIKSGNKFLVNVDKFSLSFSIPAKTEVESNDKESNTDVKAINPIEWRASKGIFKVFLFLTRRTGLQYRTRQRLYLSMIMVAGYLQVVIRNDNGEAKSMRVHRLVYMATLKAKSLKGLEINQ